MTWGIRTSGKSQVANYNFHSRPLTGNGRHERLRVYTELQKRIQELDQQVKQQAERRTQARRLLTHPGVGPLTALATEVFLGDPQRFDNGKAVASYIGMIPSEYSSAQHQRLGALSKQGRGMPLDIPLL